MANEWKDRVRDEMSELKLKQGRLAAFNGSLSFRSLGPVQRNLMTLQLSTMYTYGIILAMRLADGSDDAPGEDG